MYILAAVLFVVSIIGSIIFSFVAACNRKPGVSHFRASMVSSLLDNPSLYTGAGLKARGRFLACWYTATAIMAVVIWAMIYKRLTE